MSEIGMAVVTAVFTILGGVVIFVAGRVAERFYIDPIHRFKSLLGEIGFGLVFYANEFCNPGSGREDVLRETSDTLRSMACKVRSVSSEIPAYRLWALLGLVPRREAVSLASKMLIGLSNSVFRGDSVSNSDKRDEISNLLGLGG